MLSNSIEGIWKASLKIIKQIYPERYVDKLPPELSCTIQFIDKGLVEISKPSTKVESDQIYQCSFIQIREYIYIRGSDFEDKVQEHWILKLSKNEMSGEFSLRDFTTNSFVVAQVFLVRNNDSTETVT